MASTLPVEIEEKLLLCQLCSRDLRQPRMLPCLHVFCQHCLQSHIQTSLGLTSPEATQSLTSDTPQGTKVKRKNSKKKSAAPVPSLPLREGPDQRTGHGNVSRPVHRSQPVSPRKKQHEEMKPPSRGRNKDQHRPVSTAEKYETIDMRSDMRSLQQEENTGFTREKAVHTDVRKARSMEREGKTMSPQRPLPEVPVDSAINDESNARGRAMTDLAPFENAGYEVANVRLSSVSDSNVYVLPSPMFPDSPDNTLREPEEKDKTQKVNIGETARKDLSRSHSSELLLEDDALEVFGKNVTANIFNRSRSSRFFRSKIFDAFRERREATKKTRRSRSVGALPRPRDLIPESNEERREASSDRKPARQKSQEESENKPYMDMSGKINPPRLVPKSKAKPKEECQERVIQDTTEHTKTDTKKRKGKKKKKKDKNVDSTKSTDMRKDDDSINHVVPKTSVDMTLSNSGNASNMELDTPIPIQDPDDHVYMKPSSSVDQNSQNEKILARKNRLSSTYQEIDEVTERYEATTKQDKKPPLPPKPVGLSITQKKTDKKEKDKKEKSAIASVPEEHTVSNAYSDDPTMGSTALHHDELDDVPLESPPPIPTNPPGSDFVITSNDVKCACPVCKDIFTISSPDASLLQTCPLVGRLQHIVARHSPDRHRCDNCESTSANFKCYDCDQFLCSACRNAHNWLKITKRHKVMDLRGIRSSRQKKSPEKEFTTTCTAHPKKPVTIYCAACSQFICSDCSSTSHSTHARGDINTVADRQKDLLTSRSKALRTKRSGFQESLDTFAAYQQQCKSDRDNLLVNVQAQKERLYNTIDECYKELVKQIQDRYQEELQTKETHQVFAQNMLQNIEHTLQFTNQLAQHGNGTDVISMSSAFSDKMMTLKQTQAPRMDETMELEFFPRKLDLLTVMPVFGQVVQRNTPTRPPKPTSRIIQQRTLWEEKQHKHPIRPHLVNTFAARTARDTKGCQPTGITILSDDSIAIVDDINKKVKVFDKEGHLTSEIFPDEEHSLVDPWDIAMTKSGSLAITDKGAKCVKVFKMDGQFDFGFGPHLERPWGIACNSLGSIIVTDVKNRNVYLHSEHGDLLYSLADQRLNPDIKLFQCPEYVTVNRNDDIIVSDFERCCILGFDGMGKLLFQFGQKGRGLDEFGTPLGVAVDNQQNIFVADYNNQRVSSIDHNGQFQCFLLTVHDMVQTPQALAVNSNNDLIVADGAKIRTYSFSPRTSLPQDTPPADPPEAILGNFFNEAYDTLVTDNPAKKEQAHIETTV